MRGHEVVPDEDEAVVGDSSVVARGETGELPGIGLRASSRAVLALLSGSGPVVGLTVLIIVSWTIFSVAGPAFIGSFNLYGIGQLAALDAVLGMAQVLLVAMARMNLAIGGVAAICVSLLGFLLSSVHVPLLVALVAVIGTGIIATVLIGVVELKTGLSSFIVTLAFLSVYSGGALLVTDHANYQITSSLLNSVGSGTLFSNAICPLIAVTLVCAGALWIIYNRTSLGWKMLAVGASERAARASGVNVSRILLAAYALSGLFAAIAAVMEASYELNVNASLGQNWLLPSFIAVVLGGVALTGGEVTVVGLLLAALFYDSLQSGLTILNVPSYWLECVQGVVLLAAVVADQLRRNRRRRARPVASGRVNKPSPVGISS